ncbi:MAG: cbb3-type cytochrome oxidase assembly protein CcoS [Amylibacter sp.]
MSALLYLIPISLILGGIALYAFIYTVRSSQYDDLDKEKYRILSDEKIDDEVK